MIVDWQSSSPFLGRVLATLSLNNMIDKNIDQPGTAIDEALWTAYRRDDKAAVMDYLFHRNRVGINYSRLFPQLMIQGDVKKGRAAKRPRSERMPINGGARQISLRSALN
jgi:hypothetical protein